MTHTDGGSPAPSQREETATAPIALRMELVAALVVTAFGVFMLMGARSIHVRNETGGIDPRWWPTVIATGIIVCGLWMLANMLLKVSIERQVEPARRKGWIQMLATVAGVVILLVLWNAGVTFLILGPAFLVAINWIYGLRKWTSLVLFPGIIAAILYVVFQWLLRVPL